MVDTMLVTGASRGVGLATAGVLAEQGYRVIGIARNAPTGAFPGAFFHADPSDATETGRVLQDIRERHAIDGIVNSVGLNIPEPLGEADLAH